MAVKWEDLKTGMELEFTYPDGKEVRGRVRKHTSTTTYVQWEDEAIITEYRKDDDYKDFKEIKIIIKSDSPKPNRSINKDDILALIVLTENNAGLGGDLTPIQLYNKWKQNLDVIKTTN